MAPTKTLLTAAAAITTALLLGACTTSAAETPPPTPTQATTTTPTPTTPTPTPSTTPTPTATESFPQAPPTENTEQTAIREGWENYWIVEEKFLADPTLADLTETQYVATGEAANVILDEISGFRERNQKLLGGLAFREVVVGEPSTNADGVQIAQISYCADRSNLKVVDVTTGGAVQIEAAPTYLETATLEEGKDGTWRVAMIRNKATTC